MTPAGIGPILSGGSLPVSARDEDPSKGAAFEAALDDTKAFEPVPAPAVDSTLPVSASDASSGVTPSSLSVQTASSPVVPTSAADIVALAARAADSTATASAKSALVPDGDEDVGSAVSSKTRQRTKSSDGGAATANPQTDGTVLASMLAFMPAQTADVSTSRATLAAGSDARTLGAASIPVPSTEADSTDDAQTAIVTPEDTSITSLALPSDTAAANPTKAPSILSTQALLAGAPATPSTAGVATKTAVESAIEPGSVQISTHLGFARGLAKATPAVSADRAVSAKLASTATVDDGEPKPVASGVEAGDTGRGTQASASTQDETTLSEATAVSGKSADAIAPDASASAQTSPLVRRIADGVVALASEAASAAPASSLPEPSTRQILPARTMDLQLAPAGLGTLTVRLHVSGRSLDVTLEASDAGTAAVIDRDRSSLADALAGRDLNLQTLSVTTQDAARDPTMQGAAYASGGDTSGSNRSAGGGSSSSGQGTSGRQPGGQDGRQARGGDAPGVERSDAGLFV